MDPKASIGTKESIIDDKSSIDLKHMTSLDYQSQEEV